MADTMVYIISDGFDLKKTVEMLSSRYESKGFTVDAVCFENCASIRFGKNDNGIKKLLGMALSIRAELSVKRGKLTVDFLDGEWIGKAIGCGVGWFLCCIPLCTAGYGIVKQINLSRKIDRDIRRIIKNKKR